MEEIKLTEPELKELNRKVASINEAMITANTLERDKIAYLVEVFKSHSELDSTKIYNVDLKTGILVEQAKPTLSQGEQIEKKPEAG